MNLSGSQCCGTNFGTRVLRRLQGSISAIETLKQCLLLWPHCTTCSTKVPRHCERYPLLRPSDVICKKLVSGASLTDSQAMSVISTKLGTSITKFSGALLDNFR